jgi:hypothetical protein
MLLALPRNPGTDVAKESLRQHGSKMIVKGGWQVKACPSLASIFDVFWKPCCGFTITASMSTEPGISLWIARLVTSHFAAASGQPVNSSIRDVTLCSGMRSGCDQLDP